MKWTNVGVVIAVLAAAALAVYPRGSRLDNLAESETVLNENIAQGGILIDPAELLHLIYNDSIALRMLDVRPESDYNLFHLIGADHITPKEYYSEEWSKSLPAETVIVLMSNDETFALDAWKVLTTLGVKNLYVLRGGVNFWLDVYGRKYDPSDDINAIKPASANGRFRHEFSSALGDRQPGSEPDPHAFPDRKYIQKVKSIGGAVRKSGGCG